MFGRIRAFGAQLATSVVFLTHIAVEKAADAGLAPPPVLVGAAVAVCGTSYVVKKIHRKNLHNRNNRRPSKQKTKQSRSYEAPYDAYDQPSQPTNTEEIFTPSSPVSPKAARHATLSSARSGPTRADRTPLTGTANGYICSDVSTPLPPALQLSPYSPTGSFATALTPLTEIPDNTDQPDDYDDADESSARVDALVLSEASLRVLLGEAEERMSFLVSQHAQKQQTADKRTMLAEHQLQDLQQQLAESQKVYKQLLQSVQLQQQHQAEADREGAKAAQSAAEASRVEADEQARMAEDVIKQLRQQLQEQAAAHDAQVHALKDDLAQQGEVHRAQNAAQQAQLQALQSQKQEVCLNQRVRQHPRAGKASGLIGSLCTAIPSRAAAADSQDKVKASQ
ncbi:hypothetical protein WJX79_002071 [Trebouxia sp. C0005]